MFLYKIKKYNNNGNSNNNLGFERSLQWSLVQVHYIGPIPDPVRDRQKIGWVHL